MKNHNEEIQILSQEDESNLNSNENSRKISVDEEENINQNKSIEEFRQNNNIHENKAKNEINNNNDNDMEGKLKNFEPEKHYKNNIKHPQHQHQHQHQYYHQHHHQHQHDFSNPRYIFNYIIMYIKYQNNKILNLFSGLTMSLDMLIINSKFHPLIKRILHTKQILLLIYMINIQYLLSSIEKISFLNYLNKFSLKYFIFSVIALNIHYYFFKDKLFLEKDEELEKYIMKKNPEMKKGKCEYCNIIKICRSNHCFFCNKCVKKYQLHSDWFNICIGSNNELLYAIALFFTNFYFFISNIIIWYYILVRSDLLNYLLLIFTLFGIIGTYILFNTLKFLYSFFFDLIFVNLTLFEFQNARRMMYLWSDEGRHNYFNPFNKGLKRNVEEMFINLFDVDIYLEYKNYINQNLSEIIDDEKINQKEEEINEFDEAATFKMIIKLVDHFDPLITSKGNVYKFVDGKEIINWNRLVIFTPFDIINCPFKEMMINRAKMYLKQREIYLQKINQNNQVNETIDNKDKDENIDNKNNDNDNDKNNDIDNDNDNDNDNDKNIDNIENNEKDTINEDNEKLKNEE